MKNIDWNEFGSSVSIVKSINKGEKFSVEFTGIIAAALIEVFGVQAVGITKVQVQLILGLAVIVAIGGLVLYAIGKGYEVTGEAETEDPKGNKQKYKIKFKPKNNA